MAHLKGTAASPVDLGDPISTQDRDLLASTPGRIHEFKSCLGERILGQEETIRQLILCFFAGGHALVVGVPGLAKTLMIRSLAELFELEFARIQFTPDLMPSDITGTSILAKNETTGQREFQFRPGPILTHLLLADEINRTPPKTQAALLEAMEERTVTVSGHTRPMKTPFFVLATQNPI
ncbi:MAG: AAA family ATPase, partial [Planctomycetota bacterium]